jgi:lipoate-protein ligase A
VTSSVPPQRPRPEGELPVWRFLDLGRCPPLRAQAFVESVASSVARGDSPNTLLIAVPDAPYISLGFHQSYVEELDPDYLARTGLPVVRRVEGGGTTYLDPDQWFYQLVYRDEGTEQGGPSDLARFLRGPVRAARELGLAAEFRLPSDLVVGDRKFSGNAGGEWEGAHVIVGGYLGRADTAAMTDLLRLPDPGLRPIVRREIERWMTSWESEGLRFPGSATLARQLVDAFRQERLFDARPGTPSSEEEQRFVRETVPRHRDPGWTELPPLPRRPAAPLRRLRIAGPHGIVVFEAEDARGLVAAVVDGSEVREVYALPTGGDGKWVGLVPGSQGFAELDRSIRETPPFA